MKGVAIRIAHTDIEDDAASAADYLEDFIRSASRRVEELHEENNAKDRQISELEARVEELEAELREVSP